MGLRINGTPVTSNKLGVLDVTVERLDGRIVYSNLVSPPEIERRVNNDYVEVRFKNTHDALVNIIYIVDSFPTVLSNVSTNSWTAWQSLGCRDGECPSQLSTYSVDTARDVNSDYVYIALNSPPPLVWEYFGDSLTDVCTTYGYSMIGAGCQEEGSTITVNGAENGKAAACIILKCVRT